MPFFRPRSQLAMPRFDRELGDPKLAELRQMVEARDWVSLEFFFEQIDNWDDQTHYTNAFAEIPGTELWLHELSRREDQGTLAPLLLAARRIVMGWQIRTGARAGYVGAGQFAGFHEHLRFAEGILMEVVALEPDNALGWALRLSTARGLELGLEEARRRYQQVDKHSPHNLTAQVSYLQQICPKWGGTFEQVHTFAQECFLRAPAGGQHGELVAWAHLEQGGYLPQGRRRAYFRQPHVLAQLREAALRSVLHPGFQRGPRWLVGHNVFALAFALAEEHTEALEHFRLMGATATYTPWENFCASAEAGFAKAWNLARRKG